MGVKRFTTKTSSCRAEVPAKLHIGGKTAQKRDVPVEGAALLLVEVPQKQILRKGLMPFIWEVVSGNPIRVWGSEARMGKRPIGLCCPKGYGSRPPERDPSGSPAEHRGALSSPSATG